MSKYHKWNVANIAERVLISEGISIENDALELIRECVGEFISSLSCDSITVATMSGKRRVTSQDLISSLKAFGFDDYVAPMEVYQQKWHMHLSSCQECGKLYPVPADVLFEEERSSKLSNPAVKGQKKAKKVEDGVTNVENGNSSGNPDSAAISSTGGKKKLIKEENNNPNMSENAPVPQVKRVRQKQIHVRLEDPQFLASLRERISAAALQPSPQILLKLLAEELKIPQKTVKNLFDQMTSTGQIVPNDNDNSAIHISEPSEMTEAHDFSQENETLVVAEDTQIDNSVLFEGDLQYEQEQLQETNNSAMNVDD